jgi:peptidyl-tRNA hydrolase, PTH1 family
MKVVVGLGNPGTRYDMTKHNVGFWVVDELASRFQAPCTKSKWKALVSECHVGSEKVLLCKPQTFMNLSGESVRAVLDFYADLDETRDLMIVYDDMDFPVGQFKLREKGSAGGHNGMKSLIQHLGSDQFARVRIGIGRPDEQGPVINHVLSPFAGSDRDLVEQAVKQAADAVVFALENSFSLAMNRFN